MCRFETTVKPWRLRVRTCQAPCPALRGCGYRTGYEVTGSWVQGRTREPPARPAGAAESVGGAAGRGAAQTARSGAGRARAIGVPLLSGWRVNPAALGYGWSRHSVWVPVNVCSGRSREHSGTGRALSRAGGPGQCVRCLVG